MSHNSCSTCTAHELTVGKVAVVHVRIAERLTRDRVTADAKARDWTKWLESGIQGSLIHVRK